MNRSELPRLLLRQVQPHQTSSHSAHRRLHVVKVFSVGRHLGVCINATGIGQGSRNQCLAFAGADIHAQHIAAIRRTWNAVWNEWLPRSGHKAADLPLFERYDERFDPQSGNGGVELWVPVQS